MPIINIQTVQTGLVGVLPSLAYIQTSDPLATVMTAGYLNKAVANGEQFSLPCVAFVSTMETPGAAPVSGMFSINHDGEDWTIVQANTGNSNLITKDITLGFAALASGGEVIIQEAIPGAQYRIRDIKVNYSAAGLSGGGGNRLVTITDGTTVYNNAGITAALLGTPVNTLWGGTGNPIAGTVAQNTLTVAGEAIRAIYSGGTTDYTAGSVVITVAYEKVA